MATFKAGLQILYLCVWICCVTPSHAKAQDLFVSPYRMTLHQQKSQDKILIRMAHNFPGFVSLRVVYAWEDGGSFLHKTSVMLQGYHKVWFLSPLSPTADNLKFLSCNLEYGDYTIECPEGKSSCTLLKGGQVLDSNITFFRSLKLQEKEKEELASE